MKYRLLSLEELNELKEEFIQFLIANGIDADEWIKIKQEQSEEANKMIELFSDVVYEKALKKIQFLKHTSPKQIKYFYFTEKKAILASIDVDQHSEIDFTRSKYIKDLAAGEIDLSKNPITYSSAEKEYDSEREIEVFQMMEKGAEPCRKEEFETLYAICKKK